MKVWVVMEQYPEDDDGNWETSLEAVHATRKGAELDLVPEMNQVGYSRERYIVEMDLLD